MAFIRFFYAAVIAASAATTVAFTPSSLHGAKTVRVG